MREGVDPAAWQLARRAAARRRRRGAAAALGRLHEGEAAAGGGVQLLKLVGHVSERRPHDDDLGDERQVRAREVGAQHQLEEGVPRRRHAARRHHHRHARRRRSLALRLRHRRSAFGRAEEEDAVALGRGSVRQRIVVRRRRRRAALDRRVGARLDGGGAVAVADDLVVAVDDGEAVGDERLAALLPRRREGAAADREGAVAVDLPLLALLDPTKVADVVAAHDLAEVAPRHQDRHRLPLRAADVRRHLRVRRPPRAEDELRAPEVEHVDEGVNLPLAVAVVAAPRRALALRVPDAPREAVAQPVVRLGRVRRQVEEQRVVAVAARGERGGRRQRRRLALGA